MERNQTFSISAIDAAIQSLTHPEIKNGNYLYINSHFVLDHPKYVTAVVKVEEGENIKYRFGPSGGFDLDEEGLPVKG